MSKKGSSPAIDATGVIKQYEGESGTVTAVDGVSLSISPGEVVGLLGPNGAGKTTAIKCLLGLIVPDAGTVRVCGIDVAAQPDRAHGRVGAMLEGERNVYWRLTVRENLEFFTGLGGRQPAALQERHDRLLDRFDLADRADSIVNELSTGMKQKVSLASTLARDVDVIFLDEPTLGLDVETALDLRAEIQRLADEENVAVVLTSHDMDVIEAVSDRVVILQDGRIIANDPVERLVELFETQSFRIAIATPVDTRVRRRLDGLGLDVSREGSRLIIQSNGTDSQTIYELMRLLDETGQELRDIDSVAPDLAEIFLRLTDRAATPDTDTDTDADSAESRVQPTMEPETQPEA